MPAIVRHHQSFLQTHFQKHCNEIFVTQLTISIVIHLLHEFCHIVRRDILLSGELHQCLSQLSQRNESIPILVHNSKCLSKLFLDICIFHLFLHQLAKFLECDTIHNSQSSSHEFYNITQLLVSGIRDFDALLERWFFLLLGVVLLLFLLLSAIALFLRCSSSLFCWILPPLILRVLSLHLLSVVVVGVHSIVGLKFLLHAHLCDIVPLSQMFQHLYEFEH
mmetsp:Transcript_11370/g.42667  ORF Transcript_11370/g.42667 Transcript_11370/m.42667 type:complete len:221 (+) Transcript_11370:2303-2965(+)